MRWRNLQRAFYDMLMESQYWPADQMLEHQRSLLEPLLRHARAHVPFYQDRLSAIFTRDGSIDWDRWREIPLLTRNDLSQHRAAMQARWLPESAGPVRDNTTTGTTGVPVTTSHNKLAGIMNDAALFRAYAWHGLDYSRTLVSWIGQDARVAAYPDGRDLGIWGPRWEGSHATGKAHELNLFTPLPDVVEFARRKDAAYIATGSFRIQSLALELRRRDEHLSLDAVITRGGALSEADREVLRAAMGARAITMYASAEGHKHAQPCPTGHHYHVNAECLLLEVIGADGKACNVGETGRVVVTPLFSLAQPLIRYDLGDMATVGECSCGRTLPVLASIDGRTINMFILPDGTHVVPFIPKEDARHLNAVMWQVAQISRTSIEVRYVPREITRSPDETRVSTALRRAIRWEGDIVFRQCDLILPTASGKFLHYIREFWETD